MGTRRPASVRGGTFREAYAYFLVDRLWRVVAFDEGAVRWFGVPREKLPSRDLWELTAADAGTTFETEIRRAVADHLVIQFEFESHLAGGWVAASALPTSTALSVVLRDIDSARREQRQRQRQVFHERAVTRISEVLMERNEDIAAIRRLHEVGQICGKTDTDPETCLREILAAAIALTGADKGNVQLVDRQTGDLRLAAHAGFDAPFLTFFDHVREGDFSGCATAAKALHRVVIEDVAQSPVFAGHESLEILRGAGVSAMQSTPLICSSGRLSGMISTHFARPHAPSPRELGWMDLLARQAADYLERTEADRELHRLNEELRGVDRRKDRFLATLAHELRNPLAPIRNASRVLLLKGGGGPELQWCREVIDRQTTQLSRLLDDLLDVARIRHGKIELQRGPVEVGDALESALESVRPLLESDARDVEIDVPAALTVDGDAARLAQVFANLLNNAVKYTNAGGKIRVHASRGTGHIVVTFEDDGIGMTTETLDRVFGMFEQADGRPHGGLGIGLALARGLVTLHGGSLEARSDGLGLGSTFTVSLPAAVERPADGDLVPLSPPLDAQASRRILVVDDLSDSADSLALWLASLGHDVRTAYDGIQAIATAAFFEPQLVLLDIAMPGMDGYETCRRLRASEDGASMSIVAVTGFGQRSDQERALEAGFDLHLVKPVSADALAAVLSALSAR